MAKRSRGKQTDSPDQPPHPAAPTSSIELPIFAATVIGSAFLLFQVQPVVSRAVLPWFGGSPAVWITAQLFFQVLLFAGYLYAHTTTRWLSPRQQIGLHLVLLIASALFLPIIPSDSWKPTTPEFPTTRLLGLLAATVGLPFFALSATAPLIQVWFTRLFTTRVPYRLYALSNAGSLFALLSYPVLVEPWLGVRWQGLTWSGLFVCFAVVCALAAKATWRAGSLQAAKTTWEEDQDSTPERIFVTRILLWLSLPACASVLLLAITNYICQDVASVPLLWILPLSLYLVTFIVAFERDAWYWRPLWLAGAAAGCVGSYWCLQQGASMELSYQVAIHLGLLFCTCLACHGELVRLRPAPQHLTLFYLCLAAGGALGGFLVGMVAPYVLKGFYEVHLGLAAFWALMLLQIYRDPESWLYHGKNYWVWVGICGILVVASLFAWDQVVALRGPLIAADRNFYGVVSVIDDENLGQRILRHGRISHGTQFTDPEKRYWGTGYYDPQSGGALALTMFPGKNRRVGLVGLGAGTLAVYGKSGDVFRFYEINPIVVRMAREYFSFLEDSPAETEVMLGDARRQLEIELAESGPQNFDIFVLDAFSGDAIPTHLLTREAFQLYLRHLREEGVLAVHVSNLHLNLPAVIRAMADEFTLHSRIVTTEADMPQGVFGSTWILLSRDDAFFREHSIGHPLAEVDDEGNQPVLWTDDYSNIWGILH